MENQAPTEQSAFKIEIEDLLYKFKRFAKDPVYISLFVVLLVSLGASGYILFTWNAKSAPSQAPANFALPAKTTEVPPTIPPTVAPSLSPTPVATPTPNPLINWQTYTSTQSGYMVKYPASWVASTSTSADPLIVDFVSFNPATASAGMTSMSISTTTRTAAQLLAIYGNTGTTLTIASQSATEYDQKDSDGNQTVSIVLSETPNSYIFYSLAQYRSQLLQMLSTFIP